MLVREITSKSILSETGLPADYVVNCYVGCGHACRYCYARYMKRFTGHTEPWGEFVDVKTNAPELLAKEIRRKRPGVVMLSSVCDGWQPLEARYQLSRRCVETLTQHDWPVRILTKNALVRRDLPLLEGHRADIGVSLTTLEERIRRVIDPGASPGAARVEALADAASRGIRIWAFLGPFLPGLTDTEENLEAVFTALAPLPLDHAFVDRVNFRSGVAASLKLMVQTSFPHLWDQYRLLGWDKVADHAYAEQLRERVVRLGEKHGMLEKLRIGF